MVSAMSGRYVSWMGTSGTTPVWTSMIRNAVLSMLLGEDNIESRIFLSEPVWLRKQKELLIVESCKRSK